MSHAATYPVARRGLRAGAATRDRGRGSPRAGRRSRGPGRSVKSSSVVWRLASKRSTSSCRRSSRGASGSTWISSTRDLRVRRACGSSRDAVQRVGLAGPDAARRDRSRRDPRELPDRRSPARRGAAARPRSGLSGRRSLAPPPARSVATASGLTPSAPSERAACGNDDAVAARLAASSWLDSRSTPTRRPHESRRPPLFLRCP